eukprot:CAMPEP_0194279922 /NCGR_PEP_ID=MMETSP0169-20130528/14549_1 /TAXON_ID=218684 /ORGANISM="Corethron pennatum, Strain L29A3" /LENGTH=48 /DNA_ID= /DNA_START= /DNA_END= /DNA_ORIENTATION=
MPKDTVPFFTPSAGVLRVPRVVKYDMTILVDSVLPAPDSPLMRIDCDL